MVSIFDGGLLLAIHVELEEDDGVLGDGTEGPNKPGQVGHDVLLVQRMEDDLKSLARTRCLV